MGDRPKFKIDLDDNNPAIKPLPYTLKRSSKRSGGSVKIPNIYHNYEVEFYDTVKDCAKRINDILDSEERLKFHIKLSRIFIHRDKSSIMRLFRDLVTIKRG